MKNKETVLALYSELKKGNIPGILECVKDNVEWTTTGNPQEIPFAGVRYGKEGVRSFLKQYSDTLELQKLEPERFYELEEENIVVDCGRTEATNKLTGKKLDNKWVHIWQFEDGKIIKYTNYIDTAAVAECFRKEPLETGRVQ